MEQIKSHQIFKNFKVAMGGNAGNNTFGLAIQHCPTSCKEMVPSLHSIQ